jgi:hypothetical protein
MDAEAQKYIRLIALGLTTLETEKKSLIESGRSLEETVEKLAVVLRVLGYPIMGEPELHILCGILITLTNKDEILRMQEIGDAQLDKEQGL